jgi:hypothetical protein
MLLVPAMLAWDAGGIPLVTQPSSRLWVSGTSTVRSFECGATTFALKVDGAPPSPVAAVLAGDKGIVTVELSVPAAQLDCKNGKMNEHMLKALKATQFADISFRLESYVLGRKNDAMAVSLTGSLQLGGVTRPVAIEAAAIAAPDGALKVIGAYSLKMTEFGLQPPKLMLGALKVNELVTVNFDLLLKP